MRSLAERAAAAPPVRPLTRAGCDARSQAFRRAARS